MSSGALVAFRADRLGARIISLVNALRVGQTCGLPVKMYWIKTTGVGAEFNDPSEIFTQAFIDKHFIYQNEWRKCRPKLAKLSELQSLRPEAFGKRVKAGTDVLFGMAFGITVLDGESEATVRRHVGDIFHQLPFSKQLAQFTQKLQETLSQTVAYHIRRGDLIGDIRAMNKSWPHKYVPEGYYMAHIRNQLKTGEKVILFSDEQRTIDRFSDTFPDLLKIDDLIDTKDLPPGAQDFLQLYAMSCCKLIIAPEASAFSSTASELGGVEKKDVKADLDKETYRQGSEGLLATFREAPHELGDVGEQGQILMHIDEYLISEGLVQQACDLFCEVTGPDRRMPISFLYPRAMSLMLECGDLDGAAVLGGDLSECPIYHRKDRMRVMFLNAVSQAKKGHTDAALRTLLTLTWHDADFSAIRRLPRLIARGILTSDNFFPVSQDVLFANGRNLKPSEKEFEQDLHEALQSAATGGDPLRKADTSKAFMEPIIWDWDPLIASPNAKHCFDTRIASSLIETLEKTINQGQSNPDIDSTLGLLLGLKGETGKAVSKLSILAENHPDHVLVNHRLSRALFLNGERENATEAARKSCEISSAPAFALWLAYCLRYNGKDEANEAVSLLENLAKTAWASYPALWILKSEVEVKLDDAESALASLYVARKLAPRTVRIETKIAGLLNELGQADDACDILLSLHEDDQLPIPATCDLILHLMRQGNQKRADAVLTKALVRKPDHGPLLDLRHKMKAEN